MKKILALTCLAAALISLFTAARTENSAPYSDISAYGAGKYEVGKNLDAGEYILFSSFFEQGSFRVSADADGREVISEGTFDVNVILSVEEGDCLVMADCLAVSADDYYTANRISLNQPGGMYKVGVDIQPGEYRLKGQAGKTSVYRIYSDSRQRLAAEEKRFHNVSKVVLEENQYLELVNCSVSVPATATPVPAPTPDAPSSLTAETPGTAPDPAASSPEKTSEAENQSSQQENKNTPDQEKPNTAETAIEPTPAPTPEVTRIVRIEDGRSPVVRSLPSTKGKKIGTAEPGVEYALLEIEDKWYKIRLSDGTEGWITSGMATIVK